MDGSEFNVADCLARVREQDQCAAEELLEYLYPLVIKLVRSNLPRAASEEDLAQDIFVKVFKNLESYRGAVPIQHWVSRIAVNHCLNAIRAQSVRPEWRMSDLSPQQEQIVEAVSTFVRDQPHPADAIAAKELLDILMEALSPEDRLVIRMLELEDCSVQEVRNLTGWSATSVRVRAFRARHKLNKRFATLRKTGRL